MELESIKDIITEMGGGEQKQGRSINLSRKHGTKFVRILSQVYGITERDVIRDEQQMKFCLSALADFRQVYHSLTFKRTKVICCI